MNSPLPRLVDATAAELCPSCSHPLATHDVISTRWCAATASINGHRECICSDVVPDMRVLSHY